ncbi:Calpain-like protein [Hondaea fermentalgiana]|uniref:Calpain-like protein n=1 Tax=Hondaea fermentalgiana TaxID=2315210 RepID=A0A2R5G7Y8_9STRA|nr:Calpain-like protein [Hondaea fermentalgiana]|eukprot:GBG24151.1 Calpain-like protein [Hondaea fermentalgiana]
MGSGASSCDNGPARHDVEIFWHQLEAPLDASDVTSVPNARAQIRELRSRVARMNQHVMAGEYTDVERKCITLESDVRVPMPKIVKKEEDPLARDLMHGLKRLGVDLNEFLDAQREKADDGKFTDTEFPPEASSLSESFDSPEVEAWKGLSWERLFEFYKLYGDNNEIRPTDVQQGSLGDCYLLSSLSCLAEHPDRIRSLFVLDEVPSGCIGVRLCLHGSWQTILVDDHAPYDEKTSEFAFAHPKRDSGAGVWPCIVEKAWAKVCGSYAAIAGGDAGNALEMLTGCYTQRYDTEDPATVWQAMTDAESQGFVMSATIYDQPGDLEASVGLVEMHAYTILGVHTIRAKGRVLKVLRIRNPWGRFEWNGDWSDKSSLWTDSLRSEVGWTNENDGIFFIDLQDFSKTFSAVHICCIRKDDVRTNSKPALFCVPGPQPKRHEIKDVLLPSRRACFQLTVPQSGAYTVGVHQRERRAINPSGNPEEGAADSDFAAVRVWLVSHDDAASTIESSAFTIAKDVYIPSASLKEGSYYVFVVGGGIPVGSELSFTLSVNGPGDTQIEAMHTGAHANQPTHENWKTVSDIMTANYRARTLREGKVSTLMEFDQPEMKMYTWASALDGIVCMLYTNKSDRKLVESVDFKLRNLTIVRTSGSISTRFGTAADLTVEPGAEVLIIMEQHDPSEAYSYSFSRGFSIE